MGDTIGGAWASSSPPARASVEGAASGSTSRLPVVVRVVGAAPKVRFCHGLYGPPPPTPPRYPWRLPGITPPPAVPGLAFPPVPPPGVTTVTWAPTQGATRAARSAAMRFCTG